MIPRGASRPATRLLAMLELIQSRGRIGGRELAERLEVDPRTVRRYRERLEELGIPVESERGPHGGYHLRPGYKLPPLMLTDDEATAVVLGLAAARDLGIATGPRAAEAALAKILRVLPSRLREGVGALEESLHPVWRPTLPRAPRTDVLLVLAQSIRERREVRIRHERRGGPETERTVDPYGLVLSSGAWYLAARDRRSGEFRTFRVDRVRGAEVGALSTGPPPGFDPVRHVGRSIARVPRRWEVEVVLSTSLEEAARRIPPTSAELEQAEDGVLLRSTEYDLDDLAGRLARYGWAFTVRSPAELRAAVRRLADRLLEASEAT